MEAADHALLRHLHERLCLTATLHAHRLANIACSGEFLCITSDLCFVRFHSIFCPLRSSKSPVVNHTSLHGWLINDCVAKFAFCGPLTVVYAYRCTVLRRSLVASTSEGRRQRSGVCLSARLSTHVSFPLPRKSTNGRNGALLACVLGGYSGGEGKPDVRPATKRTFRPFCLTSDAPVKLISVMKRLILMFKCVSDWIGLDWILLCCSVAKRIPPNLQR